MILYKHALRARPHFRELVQSSSSYDSQVKRKLVTCVLCGSANVEKAIMAPQIAGSKRRTPRLAAAPAFTIDEPPGRGGSA